MTTADLDETMLALADPTRRAILERLSKGEARVTQLAEPFAISLSAVSKHILVLERAKLVMRRRQGREHYLSVNPQPLSEAAVWIGQCRQLWEERSNRLSEYLNEVRREEHGRRGPEQ